MNEKAFPTIVIPAKKRKGKYDGCKKAKKKKGKKYSQKN